MANRNLEGRGRQRGQALILVLIALAFGSLLITPTLNYVSTGLLEIRVAEDLLLRQYATDAAVEYSLWQLKYDGLTDQLNPENPSDNTTIIINDIEVPIITEITQSPLGEDWPFPVPESQSGIYLDAALAIQPPFWSEDGQTAYFPHVIYMYNSGDSAVHPNSLLQQLDPRFTYVEGSWDGFDADLTETYVDDHWELYFEFAEPLPKLDEGQATFVSFLVSTDGEIGDDTYTSSGSVGYSAFEAEEGDIFFGEYSPSTIGYYYDITAGGGSYTILVNVGITEEGDIIIYSYQFQ